MSPGVRKGDERCIIGVNYAPGSPIPEGRSGRHPWRPCRIDDRRGAVEVEVPNRSCCTLAIPSVGEGTMLVSGSTVATLPPRCIR